ncbi:MAG: aminopeptidase [Gallionellaceae bacterium]|nr:MAG: aminopeptidase [Gallionellaceae bacterium]
MSKGVFILVLGLLLSGCTSVGYYGQAVSGHMKVMRAARPIPELLQDPSTDPNLKEKLGNVTAIREFASRELALPDNGSYRAYADLGRPFVVWDVFAAPEFSVEPEKWCMAIVGCVSYRGYFDRAEAERFVGELKKSGLDTHVGGVTAYSTLGYFDDPVLNTFLRQGETETARIIFHELAHQLSFAKGDTVFNESFAATVENEGLRRWFARSAKPQQHRDFMAQQQRRSQFVRLVETYRAKLRALYAAQQAPDDMRRAKAEIMAEMKLAYTDLKASWGGDGGYDQWFERGLNNAKIASLSLYTQWVPAFEALLEQQGRDLPRFYRRVQQLARLPKEERLSALTGNKLGDAE